MVSPDLIRAWLATRPLCVQKLAAEFPIMTPIPLALTTDLGPGQFYVIGYNESDHLIIGKDCYADKEHRHHICAAHLREKQ